MATKDTKNKEKEILAALVEADKANKAQSSRLTKLEARYQFVEQVLFSGNGMKRKTKSILGIPIDNLSAQEFVEKIIGLIEECKKEQISGYISTVNSDFVSKIHGIPFTKIWHPELLKILRDSVLVTPDGAPVVWLSHLLGEPLKERVTGADLFEPIIAEFAKKEYSIYLLGGREKSIEMTLSILHARYPNLRIAGYATPDICVEGHELIASREKDKKIIAEINRCAPDLLFLNLGNPKQEIWFERIRQDLKVPLSMGVGGTYELFCKAIPRAPKWMQNMGLEWFFRLIQEPRRLWRRYAYDMFKFSSLSIPLIFYHRVSRFAYWLRKGSTDNPVPEPLFFLSPERSLSVIPLPPLLDGTACHKILLFVEEAFSQDVIILDFERVMHIDLEGISFLIKIWDQAFRLKRSIFALSVSNDVILLMKVHRIWDLMQTTVCHSPDEILVNLVREGTEPTLYDIIQQQKREVAISLFGQLNSEFEPQQFIEHFESVLNGKDCILNLRYCTFINNSGFVCLLKFQEYLHDQDRKMKICGLSSQLKTLFETNKVFSLFTILENEEYTRRS